MNRRKAMVGALCLCGILLCSVFGWYAYAGAQEQKGTQQQTATERQILYAFLLDTSRSMIGEAGHTNIFPEVKKVVIDYLDDVEPVSNIFIFPFDRGVHDSKLVPVVNQEAVNAAIDFIRGLKAEGSDTYIYRSIKDALDNVYSFVEASGREHIVIVHLFTDGSDNDPTNQYSMSDIIKEWRLKRKDHDWLYYRTLDKEIPPRDRQALESDEHIIIVEEEKGGIRPLIQIDARLSLLDFGNLKLSDVGSASEKFIVHSKEQLPPGFKITVSADCPELEARGALAEVRPKEFVPQDRVDFELTLVNRHIVEDHPGEYSGTLQFAASDPMVLIVPDRVKMKFRFEAESTIKIKPGRGAAFPLDLGKIDLFAQKEAVTIEKKIILEYNSQARERGGVLQTWFTFDDNPTKLVPGKHVLINGRETERVLIEPPTNEINIEFILDRSLKPGRYSGTMHFQSDDFTISGESLEKAADETDIHQVGWEFRIAEPPIPRWKKWLIGLGFLIVALIIGLVVFCAVTGNSFMYVFGCFRKAAIESGSSLEVMEPKDRSGESIDISGRREVTIGAGGAFISDAAESFALKAVRQEGKIYVVLTVKDGEVYMKKCDSTDEEIVFEAKVFDGDTIRFGQFIVRFSSFSLTR